MKIALIVLLCVGVAHSIYHTESMGRKHKHHDKIQAKQHHKGHRQVTRQSQLKQFKKFFHFLDGDDSQDGNDGNYGGGPADSTAHQWRHHEKSHHFTHFRSVHDKRPRKMRQTRGQRSVIVKVLELPISDPRSLKTPPSLPQPNAHNTITAINKKGEILRDVPLALWEGIEPDAFEDGNREPENNGKTDMNKKVTILVKYLKL